MYRVPRVVINAGIFPGDQRRIACPQKKTGQNGDQDYRDGGDPGIMDEKRSREKGGDSHARADRKINLAHQNDYRLAQHQQSDD